MKIRSGFVSNSSTSSFVILGIKITDEQVRLIEKKLGIGEDCLYDYKLLDDIEYICGDETNIIGYQLAYASSDEMLLNRDYRLDDLTVMSQKLFAYLTGKLEFGLELIGPIELHIGTMSS